MGKIRRLARRSHAVEELLIVSSVIIFLVVLLSSTTESSLSVRRRTRESQMSTEFTWRAEDDLILNRHRRSTAEEMSLEQKINLSENTSNSHEDIKVFTLQGDLHDGHNQVGVHYLGNNYVLVVAKSPNANRSTGETEHETSPAQSSIIFLSEDNGSTFQNVTEFVMGDDEDLPSIDGFFQHPSHPGTFAFVDAAKQVVIMTKDFGNTFYRLSMSFSPDKVIFDPKHTTKMVILEKWGPQRGLWFLDNANAEEKKLEEHVDEAMWDEAAVASEPPLLVLKRSNASRTSRTLLQYDGVSSSSPTPPTVLLDDIEDFELKGSFKFATRKSPNTATSDMDLLISYRNGPFHKALFLDNPNSRLHYFIPDGSLKGQQIFVVVVQNSSVSNLYVASVDGIRVSSPRFSLCLPRVLYFKPNVTWTDSWLNFVAAKESADIHFVEGLKGVIIASQLDESTLSKSEFSLERHVTSVVTHDYGKHWRPLELEDSLSLPPSPSLQCYFQLRSGRNCSVHVSLPLSGLWPNSRDVPISSTGHNSESGLILSTATANASQTGLGVFLSTNGGRTWRQILSGKYLYSIGHSGGLIVAVKYFTRNRKVDGATNELLWTIDEGTTWTSFQFAEKRVRVLGLMTEPGENSTSFLLFGSINKPHKHTWLLFKVDFSGVPLTQETEMEMVDFLLLARRESILRVDLNDWTNVESLPLPQGTSAIALEYDMRENVLYWSDASRNEIVRLKLDGQSDQEVVTSSELSSVEGLAFDWMARNLYVADSASGRIDVMRVDLLRVGQGQIRRTVLQQPEVNKVRGIAVDPSRGWLFWTDGGSENPSVGRSLLDGSHPQRIISNGKGVDTVIHWPHGLTIDHTGEGRLYWVDAYVDRMSSSDLDGSNVKHVISDDSRISQPFAVAVFKDKLFWDDWETGALYVKENATILPIVQNQTILMDLKVYGSGMQLGSNVCSNTNCPHLCFAVRASNGTLVPNCACSSGLQPNSQGTKCVRPLPKVKQ